ncbi:MAG: hypothetical protein V2I82_12880 [Halieaceae bacterium]|jgi:TolB-like protein|nr:hypothetical protein [Halieaceae bacterium]
MSFFSELRRRNVVRVGIAYTVTAWLLIQVADVVMENIGAPDWVMKALLFVLVVGAIPALIFAWVFELTPEGIRLESAVEAGSSVVQQTRRKLDITIIVLLLGVVAYLYWDSRLPDPDPTSLNTPVAATDAMDASGPQAPSDFEPGEKSIAVLPFVNLSSDPEQEYFSDGISEELLNVLAQIPQLRVAARTSSFQFKGDNRDISEIAELLKVQHVLEGSVRKAGTRLRITAQLIEADNGYHLWSETYDRELEDVFAIQDEISRAIADALRAELALTENTKVAGTSNTPAYEAFLKGRALINKRGKQAITEGVRELEKSVRLDPNFAPARAQLAIGIALLTNSSSSYGDLPVAEVNERAGEQIRAAEAIDGDIAEVWAAKTLLASINQDDEALVAYANRAIAIRPNYVDPLNWRVNALASTGRIKEAQAARESLLEIDPLSVIARLNAVASISVSEPERAIGIAESIAEQSPWASHVAFAQIHFAIQQPEDEVRHLLQAYALDAEDLLVNVRLVRLLARYGLEEESLRIDRDLRAYAYDWLGRSNDAELAFKDLLEKDPQSLELQVELARQLYFQGEHEEARRLYEASLVDTANGPLVVSNGGWIDSMALVDLRERMGETEKAKSLGATIKNTIDESEEVLGAHAWQYFARAQLAAVQGDRSAFEDHLAQAIDKGFDLYFALDEPLFRTYADNETTQSLKLRAQRMNDENRQKVLNLICNNNPVPNEWRPLDSTCSEVTGRAI